MDSRNKIKVALVAALIFFTAYQIAIMRPVSASDLNRLKPANQGVTLKSGY